MREGARGKLTGLETPKARDYFPPVPSTLNPYNEKIIGTPNGTIPKRYGNYRGLTLTLDKPEVKQAIEMWENGFTFAGIEEETGLDHRQIWLVLDRAVDAKLIPPIEQRIKRTASYLAIRTEERLMREMDTAPAKDVKDLWIGVGIGMDKIGASEQVQVNHAHVHVHASSGAGNDAAARFAALLSGDPPVPATEVQAGR
jgi:hypothetical protein